MMSKVGGVRVKTRVPLLGWALAGLMTLFSLTSSLVHNAPNTGDHWASILEQTATVHHASTIW